MFIGIIYLDEIVQRLMKLIRIRTARQDNSIAYGIEFALLLSVLVIAAPAAQAVTSISFISGSTWDLQYPSGSVNVSHTLCIVNSQGGPGGDNNANNVRLTVSENSAGTYDLTRTGGSETISVGVYVSDDSSISPEVTLADGTEDTTTTLANRAVECPSAPVVTTTLRIDYDYATNPGPAGTYSGTFTLTHDRHTGSGGSSINIPVTVIIDPQVRVTFPNGDLNLTYVDDGVNETVTEEFCIYSNQATADIDIDIDPQNVPSVGTAPVLSNGSNQVAYDLDLELQGGAAVTGGTSLTAALTNIANHTTAELSSETCASGNSHQFVITVSETALEGAGGGTFSDTINVVITPN